MIGSHDFSAHDDNRNMDHRTKESDSSLYYDSQRIVVILEPIKYRDEIELQNVQSHFRSAIGRSQMYTIALSLSNRLSIAVPAEI